MSILATTSCAELPETAKAATMVTYSRDCEGADIYLNDKSNDRRTCISLHASSGKCGAVEIRTLCKYDAGKNMWGEYCHPHGRIAFENRRGEKAFLAFMRELALQSDSMTPNPQIMSWYRK